MDERRKPSRSLRGRGAATNPPNRFLPIAVEREEWTDPEDPGPETRLLRDTSRSILARNDSPDVGFDVSLNPYRGCEVGCIWCMDGDTPVLMADGMARRLAELRPGDAIYGTRRRGFFRAYVPTVVRATWRVESRAYRINLEDGTELVAGGDHRFLTYRGWKFVTGASYGPACRPHLTPNDHLLGVGRLELGEGRSEDYRRGYLTGMVRGDGHLAIREYRRPNGRAATLYQFRLALADEAALQRSASYLHAFGVDTGSWLFQAATANRREIRAVGSGARSRVERIRHLVAWPRRPSREWSRGFLAGIFDAEGSYSGGILRISNTDAAIVEATSRALRSMSFDIATERRSDRARPLTVLRVRGGLKEHLRFFHTVHPAIPRKRNIAGQSVRSTARLGITSIAYIGRRTLYDITTGTGDFIANGVVSHNCYARPTHEYLGFSAGLDWETRIVVKEDAPERLREELSSRRWKPQVIALSGVTDPYQPAERRLRITRRCLEVLAEFRNPVAVITKRELVTRDIDLLAGLAAHDAAAATLSITSLDRGLQRVMEPRASVPERRLEAVRKLAAAGIPTGVMVAPVIPGLNDHEIPAILERAAEAGATRAAYVLLRLPHGLKELFEDWLERHYPERKGKVLNRLRDLRGGGLYDARYGHRMRGEGPFAEQVRALFEVAARRAGLDGERRPLSAAAFRRPTSGSQLGLFEPP